MSRQIGEASSLINCGYLGSSPKASIWSGEAQGMCNGLLNRLMPSIEFRLLRTPNIRRTYDTEV